MEITRNQAGVWQPTPRMPTYPRLPNFVYDDRVTSTMVGRDYSRPGIQSGTVVDTVDWMQPHVRLDHPTASSWMPAPKYAPIVFCSESESRAWLDPTRQRDGVFDRWPTVIETARMNSCLGAQNIGFSREAELLRCQAVMKPTNTEKNGFAGDEKPIITIAETKTLPSVNVSTGSNKAIPMTTVATQTMCSTELAKDIAAAETVKENETRSSTMVKAGEAKSSPASSTKPKQWLKLGTYSGRTEVETFLRKFSICARNNEWSDEEKLNQLMFSLVEPASQLLWESDSDNLVTWSALVQRLRERYGSAEQQALYQTQLSTRKQKADEEFGVLVHDIRRLTTLAYPGSSTVHSEAIAIRAFVDALYDRTLALKIREKEPKSLDEAYKVAMRLDGYQKAEVDGDGQSERRPGRIKAVKETESTMEALLRRLEELEKKAKQRSSATQPSNDSNGTWRDRTVSMDDRRLNVNGNDWRDSQRCYICNMQGHLARACPCRQPTNEEARPSTRRCYECHAMGHLARDCPRRQQQGTTSLDMSGQPGNANPISGQVFAIRNSFQKRNTSERNCRSRMTRLRRPPFGKEWRSRCLNVRREEFSCFYCGDRGHRIRYCPVRERSSREESHSLSPEPREECSSAPSEPTTGQSITRSCMYLEVLIGDQRVLATIDTGSTFSIVPTAWVKPDEVKCCEASLLAVNGTNLRVKGETVLSCQIDGCSFDISCFVVDDVDEMILGLDWMERHDVICSFGKRSLQVNGQSLTVHRRKTNAGCCRRIYGPFPCQSGGRLYGEQKKPSTSVDLSSGCVRSPSPKPSYAQPEEASITPASCETTERQCFGKEEVGGGR